MCSAVSSASSSLSSVYPYDPRLLLEHSPEHPRRQQEFNDTHQAGMIWTSARSIESRTAHLVRSLSSSISLSLGGSNSPELSWVPMPPRAELWPGMTKLPSIPALAASKMQASDSVDICKLVTSYVARMEADSVAWHRLSSVSGGLHGRTSQKSQSSAMVSEALLTCRKLLPTGSFA